MAECSVIYLTSLLKMTLTETPLTIACIGIQMHVKKNTSLVVTIEDAHSTLWHFS